MHNFRIWTAYLMHSKQRFYHYATVVMPLVLDFGYDGYISIVFRFGPPGGWCLTSGHQPLAPAMTSPARASKRISLWRSCQGPQLCMLVSKQCGGGLAPNWRTGLSRTCARLRNTGTGIMLAHEACLSAAAQGAVGSRAPQLMNASARTPKTYPMRMCFALAHLHGKHTKAIMSEGGGEGDGLRCRALLCRIHVRSSSQRQAGDSQRWNLSEKLRSDAWHNHKHDPDTHGPTTSWGGQPRRLTN